MIQSCKYVLMLMSVLLGAWTTASANEQFYIDPFNIEPGESCILAFQLENSQELYGFQADIKLPEGLIIKTVDGKADCSLSERASSSYSIVSNLLNESELRVGAFSLSHTPLEGYNGDILYVSVFAQDDFSGGMLSITNIYGISASDEDVEMPEYTVEIGTVHDDSLYLPDEALIEGTDKGISLILDNETVFTAFQVDMVLSDEISIDESSIELTNRADDSHSLSVKNHGDGLIRIIGFSPQNVPFYDHTGPLITMSLRGEKCGEGSISLKNIRFSTPDAREYLLPDHEAKITVDAASSNGDISQPLGMIVVQDSNIIITGLQDNEKVSLISLDGTPKYLTYSKSSRAELSNISPAVYILDCLTYGGRKIYVY